MRNVQRVANLDPARDGKFPAAEDRRFAGDATFQSRGFFPGGATSPYGVAGDLAAADPWGNPVVLQIPPPSAFAAPPDEAKQFHCARLVSAGPDGALSTPLDRLAGRLADGTANVRGDDLVLFLNRADVYEPEEP